MESSGAAEDSLTSEGFAPREEPTSPFYSTIDEPRPLFVLCVPQQGGCLRLTIAPVEGPSYEFELEEGYWTAQDAWHPLRAFGSSMHERQSSMSSLATAPCLWGPFHWTSCDTT